VGLEMNFMLICVPDTKFKYHFAEQLTKFYEMYPTAELVSVDLKELRALAVIRDNPKKKI
jgi:hypothetical protein